MPPDTTARRILRYAIVNTTITVARRPARQRQRNDNIVGVVMLLLVIAFSLGIMSGVFMVQP